MTRAASSGRSTPRARIAFVSNSARGEYTGRYRWVAPLRSEGYEVVFVLPQGEGEHVLRMRESGVQVETWKLHRSSVRPDSVILSLRSLIAALRRSRCGAIHSFGHAANLYTGLASLWLGNAPRFQHVTGLGSVFTDAAPTLRDRILREVIQWAYSTFQSGVQAVFFQNRDDMETFDFLSPAFRILTHGTGVDPQEFHPDAMTPGRRARLRQELSIPGESTVVIFVGRLLRHKGVEELLQAVARLRVDRDDLHLLVVGPLDPENASALGRERFAGLAAEPGIHLLGRREDVRDLLGAADIFVNPSHREGLPRTQLEAMAMGLPVIACDVPGSRDTVVQEHTGLLIPPRNPSMLADALEALALDPVRARKMGRAGRQLIEERFTVEICLRPVLDAYSRLVHARASS